MAAKGGDRRQKQAAKAVRRRQAVAAKQQAERLASSLAGRVAAAAAGPVDRCLRLDGIAEVGIGHVILARRLPSGVLGCGFFLVDLWCVGVKDVFYREVAPSEFEERIAKMETGGHRMVSIDPPSAKTLILGAVAFAAGCGMDPAKDYRAVFKLFDGIDAEAAAETFAFGKDGKAVYVPGPNDGPAKLRDVERRLIRARGGNGWDFDLVSSMPESQRIAIQGMLELLDSRAGDAADGPVIEHEGSTMWDAAGAAEELARPEA